MTKGKGRPKTAVSKPSVAAAEENLDGVDGLSHERGRRQFIYGELRSITEIRAGAAFEQVRNASNADARARSRFIGAIRNSLQRFMDCNELADADPVGEELVGGGYEAAIRRLGDAQDLSAEVRKTAKAKTNAWIRPWALEEIRARWDLSKNETFAERLDRLMRSAGFESRDLADAVSTSARPVAEHNIRNWRSGRSHPGPEESRETVRLLEHALGVPPGTLFEKVPKVPYHVTAARTGRGRDVDRRLAPFLVDVAPSQREEAIAWAEREVFTAPIEEFTEDGGFVRDPYALALPDQPSARLKRAPRRLAVQIEELVRFKTEVFPGVGMVRNEAWGPDTADKCVGDLLRFVGALHEEGVPLAECTLDLTLSPHAVVTYVNWFVERRGEFTMTVYNTLMVTSVKLVEFPV